MMEVMDESTLEEELKEADKVDWSSLSHPYLILISPTAQGSCVEGALEPGGAGCGRLCRLSSCGNLL